MQRRRCPRTKVVGGVPSPEMPERQERHLYRSRLASLRSPLAATLAIGSDPMTQKAAAAVVNAEGQSKTFPPLDPDTFGPQLVWFALTFGLLFLLVQKLILPRIEEVLKGRRDRISGDQNCAEELKGERKALLPTTSAQLPRPRPRRPPSPKGCGKSFCASSIGNAPGTK